MLILVGVTINISMNGGIVNKAKEASSAMQKAADLEELQMAVISAIDFSTGEVNGDDLEGALSKWTITGNGPYTCESASGNKYTVSVTGEITEGEGSSAATTTQAPEPTNTSEPTETPEPTEPSETPEPTESSETPEPTE